MAREYALLLREVCSNAAGVNAGWSFQKKGVAVRKEGNITIYGIPYSEHSSYDELRDCVRMLRPRKLIPTVNAADKASAQALADRSVACVWHCARSNCDTAACHAILSALQNPVLACAIDLFQVCIDAFLCETLLRQVLAIHTLCEELLYTLLICRQ